MAIDFMVMPISRYISGDFITPMMRAAWTQGIPYIIYGPESSRRLPADLPFGGADAPAYRERIVPMVLEDLRALSPSVARNLWDEGSQAEPRFHRVDPSSYQSLLELLSSWKEGSWFSLRRRPKTSHASMTLLLPCELDVPIQMSSPLERTAGSAKRALAELARAKLPKEAASAAETLEQAIADSIELSLPLIVDY
jgi:hypothetical protein